MLHYNGRIGGGEGEGGGGVAADEGSGHGASPRRILVGRDIYGEGARRTFRARERHLSCLITAWVSFGSTRDGTFIHHTLDTHLLEVWEEASFWDHLYAVLATNLLHLLQESRESLPCISS